MKHILNNISEEEKNAIREQHAGGMKLNTEKFKKLLETKQGEVKPYLNESPEQMKANQMAQDLLDQVKSGEATPDPSIKQSIVDCVKKGSYRHLSVVTLGAGTEILGALALLFASGVGTLPAMLMVFTGAAIVTIEGLLTGKDSGAGGVGDEIKQLQACVTKNRRAVSNEFIEQVQDKVSSVSSSSTAPKVVKDKMTSSQTNNVVPCAQLGVKSPGVCETKTKKPVKYCSELGVKSPGFCYVDTKQPVPGLKATPATKSQKTGNSVHMN